MARIRTVKPEFFRHENLFDAEKESGLPLRLAFAGLWTAADREGRFRWAPRALKLDCLPFDDVDFSRVLDALVTRGFVVRYEVNGTVYGAIPGWNKHQVINNREAPSSIPGPSDINTLTREARVDDASGTPLVQVQVEGKGREGKGTDSRSVEATRPRAPSRFDDFWKAYPRRDGPNPRKPAETKFNALVKSGVDPEMMIAAAAKLAATESAKGNVGSRFIPQAMTWLNQQRWADHAAVAFLAETTELPIEDAVKFFAKMRMWSRHAGPEPGHLGCRASAELLAKYGLTIDGRKLETVGA